MQDTSVESSTTRRKRSLPILESARSLQRSPTDGWRRAALFPMGQSARRSLFAVVRALCPTGPVRLTRELEQRIEFSVRLLMSYMPPLAARGLWFALLLLDWAPCFMFLSFRRLRRLPPERGAKILARFARIRLRPLRTLFAAVKGVVLSAYFDQEQVHRALGYAPVPFITAKIEQRRRLLQLEEAQAS